MKTKPLTKKITKHVDHMVVYFINDLPIELTLETNLIKDMIKIPKHGDLSEFLPPDAAHTLGFFSQIQKGSKNKNKKPKK